MKNCVQIDCEFFLPIDDSLQTIHAGGETTSHQGPPSLLLITSNNYNANGTFVFISLDLDTGNFKELSFSEHEMLQVQTKWRTITSWDKPYTKDGAICVKIPRNRVGCITF